MLEELRNLQEAIRQFGIDLAQLDAATVTRATLLNTAKTIVDTYFRSVRGQILESGIQADRLVAPDASMQALLNFTHGRTRRNVYRKVVKELQAACFEIEKEMLANVGATVAEAVGDTTDKQIIDTLRVLVPSAALAYEQGLLDLAQSARLSWRGPATDLREALRETLDYLAPDDAVGAQPGFTLETNTTGPTMKQKVRYILRSRGRSKAAVETAEIATDAIDGIVGTFVRSVYTRSSVSTHTPTNRDEVIRVRNYVKLSLCELLEVNIP